MVDVVPARTGAGFGRPCPVRTIDELLRNETGVFDLSVTPRGWPIPAAKACSQARLPQASVAVDPLEALKAGRNGAGVRDDVRNVRASDGRKAWQVGVLENSRQPLVVGHGLGERGVLAKAHPQHAPVGGVRDVHVADARVDSHDPQTDSSMATRSHDLEDFCAGADRAWPSRVFHRLR